MYQAQKDSVAFVKYEKQFGFICAMNYITTSTLGDSKDLHMCLLLVSEVPWLGKIENLTPNVHLFLGDAQSRQERLKYLNLNPDLNPEAVLKNPTILFPVKAGHGAFGEKNEKSYAVPTQAQLWKNENAVNMDLIKLQRLAKKIPSREDSKNKQFTRDLNKFKRQSHIFGIDDVMLPRLLASFKQIYLEKEEEQKQAFEAAKIKLGEKLANGAPEVGGIKMDINQIPQQTALELILKEVENENDVLLEKIQHCQIWQNICEIFQKSIND